jgi:mono/diheme cytochrome c family protein
VKGPAKATLFVCAAALAAVGAGCGGGGAAVKDRGAQLFAERCAGCHTLKAAGTEGSISGTRPTGPNLNQRHETKQQVLFAIMNGGFSGAIMPQNVVVGKDAQAVADFVAKYAGKSAKSPPGPTATGATGGASGGGTTGPGSP